MFMADPHAALVVSVAVTLLALFVFGYVKGRFTGTRPIRSALQTALIGGPGRGGRVPDRAGVLRPERGMNRTAMHTPPITHGPIGEAIFPFSALVGQER